MAYQENIPQPGDALQKSQGDLLGNFQSIKQLIDVNHSTFGSATEGKHSKVEIPNLATAPVFGAGDSGFFNNNTPLAGGLGSALFIVNPESGGGASATPITARKGKTGNGWSYLTNGVLLKWGTGVGTGHFTIAYPVGATNPVFTTTYQAFVSVHNVSIGVDTDRAVRTVNITNTALTVFCGTRTTIGAAQAEFRYLIVGAG